MKKFDTILWRINGIILLSLGSFGVYGMSLVISNLLSTSNSAPQPDEIVEVNEETKKKEIFQLGDFSKISATDFSIAPYWRISEEGRGWESGSGYRNRIKCNYFFLNLDSLDNHWLFSDNNRVIHEHIEISKSVEIKKEEFQRFSVAHLFEVQELDSKDDRPGKRFILLSSPTGSSTSTVINELDAVLGKFQKTDTEYIVLVSHQGSYFAYHLDLENLGVIKKEKIEL